MTIIKGELEPVAFEPWPRMKIQLLPARFEPIHVASQIISPHPRSVTKSCPHDNFCWPLTLLKFSILFWNVSVKNKFVIGDAFWAFSRRPDLLTTPPGPRWRLSAKIFGFEITQTVNQEFQRDFIWKPHLTSKQPNYEEPPSSGSSKASKDSYLSHAVALKSQKVIWSKATNLNFIPKIFDSEATGGVFENFLSQRDHF